MHVIVNDKIIDTKYCEITETTDRPEHGFWNERITYSIDDIKFNIAKSKYYKISDSIKESDSSTDDDPTPQLFDHIIAEDYLTTTEDQSNFTSEKLMYQIDNLNRGVESENDFSYQKYTFYEHNYVKYTTFEGELFGMIEKCNTLDLLLQAYQNFKDESIIDFIIYSKENFQECNEELFKLYEKYEN